MSTTFATIEACVFDAYGTLFDFGSAAASCRDALGDQVDPLTRLWRDKQLQYAWLRDLQGRHVDFWQVTGDALDYSLAALGLEQPALRDRLMNLYLTLAPFPEVPDMLRRLKTGGMRSAILSNGSPAMLKPLVEQNGLADLLDGVLSVEQPGCYKPDRRVYQLAVDHLGVPADKILFLSSIGWDAYAASAFGMKVAWCNRYAQPPERLPGQPDTVIRSLAELPGLLGIA